MATLEGRPTKAQMTGKQKQREQYHVEEEAGKTGKTVTYHTEAMPTRSFRKRAASSSAAHKAYTGFEEDRNIAGSSRERALQAELDIAKRQVAFLPFLKEKFDALVAEHAESKARYASKAAALKEQVQDLEKKSKASQADSERLRAESLAKTSEVRSLGNELGRLRSAKGEVEQQLKESQEQYEEEKTRRKDTEEQLEEAQGLYKNLATFSRQQSDTIGNHAHATIKFQQDIHDSTRRRLEGRLLTHQLVKLKLERKIDEKDDQVCQLVELILQSEDEQSLSETRIEDLEEDLQTVERLRAGESRLFRHERRRLMEQVQGLNEDFQHQAERHADREKEWNMERSSLRREVRTAVAIIESQEEALNEMQSVSMAKFQLEQDLAGKEVELEDALKTVTARDEEISSLKEHLAMLQQEKVSLSSDLASTQDALNTTEQDLTNERAQRRHMSSLLVQSQATETQLQEEVFSLQNDLVSYLQLQETHADLMKHLDRLMRTADLAEEDAKELARMNSELAGHNNPNQRIRQLDRLRNELAELKKKYVTGQADLAAHKGKIAALEAEVASYKSVDEQRPKVIKHVQALKNSTNIAKDGPLHNIGFGHVSVRKSNVQQVDQGKAAKVFGQQRGPVKSFLS